MAEDTNVVHEFEPHAESYDAFIKLTVATVFAVLFILVGLLAVGFAQSFSVLVGSGTIIVGIIAVALTLMTGGRNWLPCAALFVLSFLLTATLLNPEPAMKIAVPRETETLESRVSATPDTVKKYVGLGCDVVVQAGAGAASDIPDAAYEEAGAKIEKTATAVLKSADIVLKVRRPGANELKGIKKGAVVVAMMDPYGAAEAIRPFATKGITAFSMELMPRITRAQTMDVLSSQSNLAGYKAVIDAAAEFGRALPMMMTAAGTVPAARVFVMGAGVAGLQAIATARRLGAIVSATDVRRAAGEQVASLGAKFVMVEAEEDAETAGGYAKEMSEDYQRKQAELIANTVKQQDIVVCTALIPGRPAPTLVTGEMVASMKPGSIIVDLAVERGGNCALSKPDEIVTHDGVKIIGYTNMAGRLAGNASQLYAKNLLSFLDLILGQEKGKLTIDWDDEIIAATALTRDGELVNPVLG